MKIAGMILIILGAIGLIIASVNYANQTDKFNLLGINITISQGSIIPIVVTGIIFLLGIFFFAAKRS